MKWNNLLIRNMLSFHLRRSFLMFLKFSGCLHIDLAYILKCSRYIPYFFSVMVNEIIIFLLEFNFLKRLCFSKGSDGSNLEHTLELRQKKYRENSLEGGQALQAKGRKRSGPQKGAGKNTQKTCLVSCCCFSQ